MGEVSKRCRTSGCAGQQRIGSDTPTSVGEVRRPIYYQAFLDELLQRSTKTAINCDLSIESPATKSIRFATFIKFSERIYPIV